MWTVMLLLKPAVVTAHLIGGMAILSIQIFLGGWTSTSTNYAALACHQLPLCDGPLFPGLFDEVFKIWHGLGQDYEGGVLSHAARMTIHAAHRVGAVVTILYIGLLATILMRTPTPPLVR